MFLFHFHLENFTKPAIRSDEIMIAQSRFLRSGLLLPEARRYLVPLARNLRGVVCVSLSYLANLGVEPDRANPVLVSSLNVTHAHCFHQSPCIDTLTAGDQLQHEPPTST
jgi:hypothetical protein